jgi:hypothetical protein
MSRKEGHASPDDSKKEDIEESQVISRKGLLDILRLIAAIVGPAGGILTFVSSHLSKPKDPFLIYYFISACLVLGAYWLIMNFTSGENQKKASRGLFLMLACCAAVAVVWRAISVYFFLRNPSMSPPPGYEHTPNYIPYFILIGTWALLFLYTTLQYTSSEKNRGNTGTILGWFFGLSIYLALCRIAWHYMDMLVTQVLNKTESSVLLSLV